MMNGLENIDVEDVLEDVGNVDTGVGVRWTFYVCRRCRRERQSVKS